MPKIKQPSDLDDDNPVKDESIDNMPVIELAREMKRNIRELQHREINISDDVDPFQFYWEGGHV